MGVYLTNNQEHQLGVNFNTACINKAPITTWDGLVFIIAENPLAFVADNYQLLEETNSQECVRDAIRNTNWIDDKDDLLDKLNDYMSRDESIINEETGYAYFNQGDVHKSLAYLVKAIELLEEQRINNHPSLDQIYAKIGICLIAIGEVDEGIDLLDYAYHLLETPSIELELFKYQLEFDRLDNMSLVESKVEEMVNESENDKNLSFLVWYYDYLGESENSITSYMQIQNLEIRFKLVDYYMNYMLESKQQIAMESFLRPLRDEDEARYLLALIDVHIQMADYEHALEVIDGYTFPVKMNQLLCLKMSYCYLKLNRVIESVTAINKVKEEQLTSAEEESYYVQLARLSRFSKDLSKEHIYHQSLLGFWQQQYRNVYSGILHNTKWKVKK